MPTPPPDGEGAPPALTSRLLTRRTLLSIGLAVVIVVVAVWRAPINWGDAWDRIRHADPLLYVAGLVVYYLSMVVRGIRWKALLVNTGARAGTVEATGILVASFFVNCVVPAKMGDVYRAYLGRVRLRLSGTKALGTIVAERLLDLCVLMALLLAAGAWVFHRHAPSVLMPYFIAGTVICFVGVAVVVVMAMGRGKRFLRLLPEAVFQRYQTFQSGTVESLHRLPLLVVLTALIWVLEGTRLGFVVFALGDGAILGPSQFMLIALVAALLTTVPFLPGGLGLVEAGMVGVLVAIGDVNQNQAVSIALLDRSISYGSLVVLGFIVFFVTHLRVPHHQPHLQEPAA